MRRFALLLLSAFFLLATQTANAHTTLLVSDPQQDATVQSWPEHITLTFAEPLQVLAGAEINTVRVTNARVESLEGATTVIGNVLTVAVSPNTAAGPVLVNYRIASADGHILQGEYSFNYQSAGDGRPSIVAFSHHAATKNFPILASSITLILFSLLLGILIYRNKSN